MSRSYKHNYIFKLHLKDGKKFAKRAVRRYKGELKNGCFYKKVYSSWGVVDYTIYYSKPEVDKTRLKFKTYLNELKNLSDSKLTYEEAIEHLEWLIDNKWKTTFIYK